MRGSSRRVVGNTPFQSIPDINPSSIYYRMPLCARFGQQRWKLDAHRSNNRCITQLTHDALQDSYILYTHLSDLKKTTLVTHHQVPTDDDCMLGGAVISAWILYKPTSRCRGRVAERRRCWEFKGRNNYLTNDIHDMASIKILIKSI
jgi:hypothetical protein